MHGLHTATLELLPCGLVRVSVPTIINWTPGQHVFVRFLTSDLHLLTAHPFTISSACRNPDKTGKASKIIFYIKPRRGVTARLAAMAAKQPGISKTILLEGPYGGVSERHMAHFDTLLVIAGGSGGGFSLAMVDEALRLSGLMSEDDPEEARRKNLQVIFSTRDIAMADWYTQEIESRLSKSTELSLDRGAGFETSVSVHITSKTPKTPVQYSTANDSAISFSTPDPEKEPEQKLPSPEITTTGTFSLNVHRNIRPDIPSLLARTVTMAHAQGNHEGRKLRVGVLACGPASMLHDTRNAAASAQARAFGGDVEDVYLHCEPFG